MKKLISTALCALALAATAACSATPQGQDIVVEGRLVLKGSAPHPMPVLVQETKQWELQGMPEGAAQALQNKNVVVTGTVTRDAQVGSFRLPALRVVLVKPRE